MKYSMLFSLQRWLILPTVGFLTACKPAATPESTVVTPVTIIETTTNDATAADVFLILPGDYAQKTTVADLEKRFGVTNVRRENGERPSVTLFPDDPTRRAYVAFHEAASLKEVARITVSDAKSRWRGKYGVHVGMTLTRLRELNGKPFYLSGFDAQQRARALDGWSPAIGDDATLGAFDVAEGDHLYFEVELGVVHPIHLKNPLPDDVQLSSEDPRLLEWRESIQVTSIGASSSLDDEWE